MKIYPTLGALVLGCSLLSGCGEHSNDWGDKGPVVSERREVGSFDSIDMDGAAKIEIAIGEPVSVQIHGHEGVVSRLETEVRGDTLHIKTRKRDWVIGNSNSRLTVNITVPRLESLELQGGNDVSVTGLHGGDTQIKAAGAANIVADGNLEKLQVRMTGAGHADLSKLAVMDASVTVDGVGSVLVNARDSLDATMNGVGAIFYSGTPQRVNTRMNGLGTIAQQDSNNDSDVKPKAEPEAPVDPDSLELEREDPKQEKVNSKPGQTIVI
ncbi:GIN domain-containing protein [Steroidobacter sp.]|uniref:GIN domain-containing protein n=1 Tax=Steroidobacter sp. TaxID=1978227 RepID=UPI001A417E2E|nr:DUF2807 domain-containing protein [Steroidobacter sp.]MBL8270408.1 DUF2807 domain-containing protein [Steroidobacter sp.]